MKMRTMLLPCALLLGVTGCQQSADNMQSVEQPQAQLTLQSLSQVSGENLLPLTYNNQSYWLLASEKLGLSLIDAEQSVIAKWQGNVSQVDYRQLQDGHTLLISALDNNTSDIHLLTLDLTAPAFTLEKSLPAVVADIETVCLQQTAEGINLYSADANGQATQRYVYVNQTKRIVDQEVRKLLIGPGLSDCAVADNLQTLFMVEQDTGIWHYDAFDEAEDSRELQVLSASMEIESISVTANGEALLVSPDKPTLWYVWDETVIPIALPEKMEPGTVNLSVNDNATLTIGLFDEASGQLFQGTVTLNHPRAVSKPRSPVALLKAAVETQPVNRFGDAADDPAIWVNQTAPEKSRILGTDKKYGLNVYDLAGNELQSLPVGRVNNVDIRTNIQLGERLVDIAAASNRSNTSVSLFTIAQDSGEVTHLLDFPTDLNDVYGLCLYQGDTLDVLVNDTSGDYRRYRLDVTDTIHATEIERFSTPSQPEGCVADDASGRLYYGEEAIGVWQRDLIGDTPNATLIAEVGGDVEADIEGVGLYQLDSAQYLVVSSQGNNRYAVYALNDNNRLIGTFSIGANVELGIDGVSETDGLEVTATPLGTQFPDGLMVVQDGRNVMPMAPQNFKLVSGSALAEFIRKHR